MHDVEDLNIKQEILPFFDFTLNSFSRLSLGKLMITPLESPERIRERQQVLKGFISNAGIFREYTYSRTDFYEVKRFLTESSVNKLNFSDRLRLLISENDRMALKARFIQLITLAVVYKCVAFNV
jgi:DNA mismatch repair protein MutS